MLDKEDTQRIYFSNIKVPYRGSKNVRKDTKKEVCPTPIGTNKSNDGKESQNGLKN